MSSTAFSFRDLWTVPKESLLKVFYLGLTFFLLTATQAIWRPLKTSLFVQINGVESIPNAKIYVLCFLIPLIILYSKLVDWLKRHQMLYAFALVHSIGGLIIYYALSNPYHGLDNPSSPYHKTIGWVFYFFMESFSAFLSTTFWSFADSITSPQEAKKTYGLLVSCSKLGGMLAAGTLYGILTYGNFGKTILLTNTILTGSLLLLASAGAIFLLNATVPQKSLHGYQAAYTEDKKEEKARQTIFQSFMGAFEGITITLRSWYALGIFSLIFFYETVIVIFDYRVLVSISQEAADPGSLTAYYAFYFFCMHGIGLLISFFGTTPLQQLFGIRASLVATPLIIGSLIVFSCFFPSARVLFVVLVLIKAINYALNHPTREVLYIPTTKAIRFKAKAWSDAFGSRFGKSAGSTFNILIKKSSPDFAVFTGMGVSCGLIAAWIFSAYALGKKFQHAVKAQQIIGSEKSNDC